ncbi:MAG: major facilitator superfamily 1 [Bacteroidetes bacterium]|jgi:PAT family beta-lactamase induction signal transducer AmpG|nr:major facilitator superfamily 1 [Bacteroidota bacterium]
METEKISSNKRHPATWVPSVYFAMGLPFVALSTASALMFKNLGISDSKIAFWTSLIMIPWTLKPIWSPLLEMFKTKKHFVVATQLITGITFALIAFSLHLPDFFTYAIAFMAIIGFSGATHDIATVGIYLNELSPEDQAKYVGWQGAFYNIAKILSGGALVYIAGELEKRIGIVNAWTTVMSIYGIIMVLLSVYHLRILPSGGSAHQVKSFKEGMLTLKDVAVTFFEKKGIFLSILFVIFYRFAEGFAIKIAPLFFKATRESGGLGLSTSEIGMIYGIFGAAAFVLGSIVAGYFTSSQGLKKSILILCAAFNIPFIMYALLAWFQPANLYIISAAVILEYFGYGFGFVGLILYIMQQISPGKYKTAHYAFADGIMALGFMLPSMISGFLSDMVGYKTFFIFVLMATIPSFLVTVLAPFPHTETKE